MRVLIACDKYKGSLTATQVARTIREALSEFSINMEYDLCPIADGGEGTAEAMVTALGGEWVAVSVNDARGRLVEARYGWIPARAEAVMEMSAASGLAMVNDLSLNPAVASTAGTGEMLRKAMERGARSIVIGIGGSATNDGGLGMAAALGYQFLDKAGNEVPGFIQDALQIARIEQVQSAVAWPKILVACDVDNPLLGKKGATQIYGPQKGVRDTAFFEERLQHLADLVARDLGVDPRDEPGAGAAGGLGFGLMAFCGATLTSGFDLVAEQIGLEERIANADLVITGEGRLDAQTLHGKGPAGVAKMARRFGKKVVAFAGSIEDSPALRQPFDLAFAIKPPAMPLPEAIQRAEELLAAAVSRHSAEIGALVGLA